MFANETVVNDSLPRRNFTTTKLTQSQWLESCLQQSRNIVIALV
jgi:hypothetical protein